MDDAGIQLQVSASHEPHAFSEDDKAAKLNIKRLPPPEAGGVPLLRCTASHMVDTCMHVDPAFGSPHSSWMVMAAISPIHDGVS